MKKPIALLSLLLALLLTACGEASAPASTTVPTPEPTATPVPTVQIGTLTVSADAEALDLTEQSVSADEFIDAAAMLPNLREIELGETVLGADDILRLKDACPETKIHYYVNILGIACDSDAESIDLTSAAPEDVDIILQKLPLLQNLRSIDLAPEEGLTALSLDDLARIRAAAGDAELLCSFELFGQTVTPETSELRYWKAKLSNDCIEVFRAHLPYLPRLGLLRFYACGITDYDAMVELNNAFPDVNVVWSVEIAGYNFMTDTVLFHCPLLRDSHVPLMKYFPDLLYLDVGHNRYLTTIDFVRNFPKLQVVILSITKLTDISALAECPELEYVELLNTHISDISPLANLTKIEYLNIGDMPYLQDISCVFNMTSLKQVRICKRTYNGNITMDDAVALQDALPDCFVSMGPGDPTTSGLWRFDENHNYTERYAHLREQMLYDNVNWQDRQSNSPTRLAGDRER